MGLSTAQLQVLRAAVVADPAASVIRATGSASGLRDWLNGSTGTLAWRTAVEARLLDEGADYSAYDSVADGKRDAWAMFLLRAPRDMAKNRNRKVVTDVWGNATAGSVAESVLQASTEPATRAQAALGGTSRSTGTVTALDRSWAEPCALSDAEWIINN